ncbi:uncharacterized protein PHA67_000501 isoform 2-T2 [Liasis olivaceus]
MMEIVRNCQNPTTSAEAHAPYQMPMQDPDPTPSSKPGLNPDQEMQWSLVKEDCTFSDPSLNRQLFLAPPQDLGSDPSKSLPSDPCGSLPREEMSFQELPEVRGWGEGLSAVFKEPDRWPFEKNPNKDLPPGKTRLPSIVVEPSEGGEVESGELQWPPEDFLLLEGAERDELLDEDEVALEAGLSSFESDVEELFL